MKKSVLISWDKYQKLIQQEPMEEQKEDPVYNHERIIATVPQKSKSRARALLDLLSQTDISWNSDGECVLDGKSVQGSNICDLLKCVLLNYKTFQPKGYDEFIQALASNNVPETLIMNTSCRNDIQHLKCKPKSDAKAWLTL